VNRTVVRWFFALALLASSLSSPVIAVAQAAPFCEAGQSPAFIFGFADLKYALGYIMGDPVECEHANSANGDTLQQTTTGLAIYRQATNTPEFTDGWNHWALTDQGVVAWSGSPPDAPSVASQPAAPAATGRQCMDVGSGLCITVESDLADTRPRTATPSTTGVCPRTCWVCSVRAATR
jgi:hypothetical protein